MKKKRSAVGSNYLVRDSRAGDKFHYCWMAKRSLVLLQIGSKLERIILEGDISDDVAGEYSLDATEVYCQGASFDRIKYQFKYSVERIDIPIPFSELKRTLVGFSENYQVTANLGLRQHYRIVSNRRVSEELKSSIKAFGLGFNPGGRTANSFREAVKLDKDALKSFCSILEFRDAEVDLDSQLRDLRVQAASCTAGIPSEDSIHELVDMVARKALPKSNREITAEDVLSYFCRGVSSKAAFYPAPPKFDDQGNWIETSCYRDVRVRVAAARRNVFVHAAGGMGKTVTLRRLASDLPQGSEAIIFDCFASGEYLSRLQYRHTPTKAFVQIANELASRGLCNPLIAHNEMSPQLVVEAFSERIKTAVSRLQARNADARLYVFIDAADNARMAADTARDVCFVDLLLDSDFGEGCCFVFSARTGRMNAFWPELDCDKIELSPFTVDEVHEVIRGKFKDVNLSVSRGFFVRTSGLPRVVAGILADCKDVRDIAAASSFAPLKDYDSFLCGKYQSTLKRYSASERKKLDKICRCLVLLPPNVPIKVLCSAAGVSEDFLLGFMADWERPLWRSQGYVHFRDEPTETWFRSKFGEAKCDLQEVVNLVKPLSAQYVYAAQVLPELLLKTGDYVHLSELAGSDEALPDNIHVSERKALRLERLRFAVSAMIRIGNYSEAMRLAMIAGDMASESVRRDETIKDHLVFASRVLPQETVRELAGTRRVQLLWRGSENLCAAVLLAALPDSRDEVDVCLQSAIRWLQIQFDREDREMGKEHYPRYRDYSHEAYLFSKAILDVKGVKACVNHLCRWRSGVVRCTVASCLAHDCVVFDKKEILEELIDLSDDVYVLIGLSGEATSYGGGLSIAGWRRVAQLILTAPMAKSMNETSLKSIRLSVAKFAVWIAGQKGGRTWSLKLLKKYYLAHSGFRTFDGPYDSAEDSLVYHVFEKVCQKKACSPRAILAMAKKVYPGATQHEFDRMQVRLRRLIPVYAKMAAAYLSQDAHEVSEALGMVSALMGDYELFHQDKSRLFLEAVRLLSKDPATEGDALFAFVEKQAQSGGIWMGDLFDLALLLRRRGFAKAAGRCQSWGMEMLAECRRNLEESPTEIADLYLRVSEACYASDVDDASGYFSEAIEALSKCGDELLPRWSAVTAIARRLARSDSRSSVPRELVYDFTRCGEYVRRCVCRDKYYDREEVFSILVDFDPAYAWATYSRWRDRGVGSFSYDIGWITEMLIDKGVFSFEEAWSLRAFGDGGVWNKLRTMADREKIPAGLKRKALDELMANCRKNGCSENNVDLIRTLANELNVSLPQWVDLIKDPQASLWRERARKDTEQQFSQVPDYDGKDPDWVYNTLGKNRPYWTDECRDVFFSKIPENFACPFLRSIVADRRISRYDIQQIIHNLPTCWSAKPGVRNAMPDVLSRLVARSVEDRAYDNVMVLVERAKDYGLEGNIAEHFLKCMANVDCLGCEDYYQLVKLGLPVLSQAELVSLLKSALERASAGMPEDFGDGRWNEEFWPNTSFTDVAKDVLWAAMGDPDVGLRWDATHCMVSELLRIPNEMVGAGISRLSRMDFAPCVSRKLPFYFDFSRMHFLLALAKVSSKIAPAVRKHSHELIDFLRNQEHVLVRYLGWQALVGARIAEKELSGINPWDDIKIHEIQDCAWNVEVEIDPSVRDAMKRGDWFPTHYDFDKYWVPSLLSVFGLEKDDCRSLLSWAVQEIQQDGHWSWARNQDPRNDQFRDDGSTEVSEYEMPEKSDYNFYTAYNALMLLAGRLLKCQPVIKEAGDSEDRFSIWMREVLPVFSPDATMWHSDLRGALPMRLMQPEDLREDIEKTPLRELDLTQLLEFSACEDQFSVDGFWRIGDYPKELECSLSCALVATKDAERVRARLSRMKDPYSFVFPTLFDQPDDGRNHGNFPWRGLYDAGHTYPRYHLDENDPRACGLRLTVFNIAGTICDDLGLKTCADHVSLALADGGLAFGAHYWGRTLHSREESPGTYGATLNVTREALRALCAKYDSELIVELVLKRYKKGYYHNFYRREEEEKCYRYALISPDRGVS